MDEIYGWDMAKLIMNAFKDHGDNALIVDDLF